MIFKTIKKNPYTQIQPKTREPYTIIYLVRHANPDYRLRSDSVCINAGLNQDWMIGATDLAGHPRIAFIRGENVDIGAYEYWVPLGAVIKVY